MFVGYIIHVKFEVLLSFISLLINLESHIPLQGEPKHL